MTDNRFRRLPVGIQSFKVIREENYLYVDKSDIVWNMVNLGDKYNYLSRPRRFGKSVLVDTLESYLEGRKDLFEGLKIMQLEKDWKQYPVIRLDMSLAGSTAQSIQSYLNDAFSTHHQVHTDISLFGPQQSVQHQLYARICCHLRHHGRGDKRELYA